MEPIPLLLSVPPDAAVAPNAAGVEMGVERPQWFHMEVAAPGPESFIHQFFRKLSSWVREAVGLSGDDDDFVEEEYPFAVIYTFPHHPYRLESSQNPLHLEIPQQTKNKALAHGVWIAGAVGVLLGFLLSQYNLRSSLGKPIGHAAHSDIWEAARRKGAQEADQEGSYRDSNLNPGESRS